MDKITVWDYTGRLRGLMPWHLTHEDWEKAWKDPVRLDVEAECVGGEDGILAFFYYKDYFCIAAGDDGHWWLIYNCHKSWAKLIKSKVKAVGGINEKNVRTT